MSDTLDVALCSAVFHGDDAAQRLTDTLCDARIRGADLVVLPELPTLPWVPSTSQAVDADAEPPGGPRHAMQAAAAKEAGVALLGGAIVVDPATGARHNTALLFDAEGALCSSYRKVHLPQEPGFHERDHYVPGTEPPAVVRDFDVPFGVQICSDVNRPQGTHLLAALGADAILAPRATEASTYDRWELVLRANALTACAYVVSVNRPGPERGVELGGPSVAIGPDGRVLERLAGGGLTVVRLDRAEVARCRGNYPGYLQTPADLYARGWQQAAQQNRD